MNTPAGGMTLPELLLVAALVLALTLIVARHYRWRAQQFANHAAGRPHEHLWADSSEPEPGSYFCEWRQRCAVCGEKQRRAIYGEDP